jgi:RNA polymerase sigma factor (sigma-70 family)
MSGRPLAGLVRAVAGPPPGSDAELLGRFVDRRCPDAFAALVHRHGPTVLGVCRRTLGDGPDADDAFQAVWLVLVRKAPTVRPRGRVGPFLYGVAVRTAAHVRGRRRRHGGLPDVPDPRPVPDAELAAVIDAELSALPAAQRAAVVLCEIEGRSLKEAAGDLGVPVGTLASRLARGRQRLADRLRRRGVAISAAGLSGWLATGATARVPAVLLARAGEASPAAGAITQGVLTMLLYDKLRRAAAGLVLAGGLAAGGLGVGWGRADPMEPARPADAPTPARPADPPKPAQKVFDQIWNDHHPESVLVAAFAMLDDPDRAVDYLDEQLLGFVPDPQQVTTWLADLGVGDPAALKAAAERRRAVLARAGDATPGEDVWPPTVARRRLRGALSVPSVYARLRKLTTELPAGSGRQEVIQVMASPFFLNDDGGGATVPADAVVTFGEAGPNWSTDQNGRVNITMPSVHSPPRLVAKAGSIGSVVRVLERLHTPRAVAVLKRLAACPPEDVWVEAAKAALDRLAKK